MTEENLRQILDAHKPWLVSNGEDGEYANLREAELLGANIDYSCWPLWCGGLDVHIDDRQAMQLLYHLARNVLFSKNTSKGLKRLFGMKSLVKWANKFYRAEACGLIETNEEAA